jgi:hypothetical protein
LRELGRDPLLSALFDVDIQRHGAQPVEIDLGDDRVLRPEVRPDRADADAGAFADRPHGHVGIRHLTQQLDGRVQHPARFLVIAAAVVVRAQVYDVGHVTQDRTLSVEFVRMTNGATADEYDDPHA